MEAKLPTAAPPDAIPGKPEFPYTNWGPWLALLGVLMALGTAIVISVPIAIVDNPARQGEDLSGTALALAQLAQELSFLLVPFALAASKGATVAEAMRRLGLRRLPPARRAEVDGGGDRRSTSSSSMVYVALVGEPEQDDFADDLGPLWIQILLIAIAAPIGEEVCFRGMLFGGLRERLPMWAAALISAALFGAPARDRRGSRVGAAADRLRLPAGARLREDRLDRALHPAPHAEQFRRPTGSVASPP